MRGLHDLDLKNLNMTPESEATHFIHLRLTQYADISAGAILIYDYLLTLGQEVDFLWRPHWSLSKLVFFLIRYCSLSVIGFNTQGYVWYRWQFVCGLIFSLLPEGVLCLRIYAMYNKNKRILIVLLLCVAGSIVSWVAVISIPIERERVKVWSIPGVPFEYCSFSDIWGSFYSLWIPILFFEAVLFALALYKGYGYFRSQLFSHGLVRERNILSLIVRDSIRYFVVVFSALLVTFIFWTALPTSDSEIPIGFTLAMIAVMSERLIMNVFAYSRSQNFFSTMTTPSTLPGPSLSNYQAEEIEG